VRLDESALKSWGERIGARVQAPVLIGLSGPLGAGKSVLARAIASGAGIDEVMPSPSYNLRLEYDAPTGVKVIHMDLYRIEDPDEVWELGWSDVGAPSEIVLVEWPERARSALPADWWSIELTPADSDPLLRDVVVERHGAPPELPGFPISVRGGR
jgi:tRNA threonylcarbamoyladenosine biosynthesis protein TsaE